MKSPVQFNKQADRDPITKGVGCSDERFTAFNHMPKVISKYRNSPSPDFTKSTKGEVDDFLMTSGVVGDNANNQSYEPNYEYHQKNLKLGVPMFDKIVSRDYCEKIENSKIVPDSYDHDKISTALTYTSNHHRPKKVLKFDTIPGREDNLIFNGDPLIDEKK